MDDKPTEQPAPVTDEEVVEPTEEEQILTTPDVEGEVTDNAEKLEPDSAEPEEEPEAPTVEETVEPEKDEAGVYEPPKTIDPGDFKPGDYSFEITTTDGRTHKISTPEDAEALASRLDDNPELISASQFMHLARKTASMEQGIATDKRAYDQTREAHEAEVAQTEMREQVLTNIHGGFSYLEKKGLVEPIPPEFNKPEIKFEDHLDKPWAKQRVDILKQMEADNNDRMAAGLTPVFDPISTFNTVQLEKLQGTEKDTTKKSKQASRSASSRISGKSPYISDSAPKGSIVGAGRSLDDVVTEAYYNQ